jgi:large subunit ribosomal protein L10e
MGIRPARSIRDADKVAWTRFSRRRPRKSFVKSMPHADLHQFMMGVQKDDYDALYELVANEKMYHRDNAIEAARQSMNKELEKGALEKFFAKVRVYPHHIIRENKMVAGAGADRIQKGMRGAFGKPIDRAALVKKGQTLIEIRTYSQYDAVARRALTKASRKLSGTWKTRLLGLGAKRWTTS